MVAIKKVRKRKGLSYHTSKIKRHWELYIVIALPIIYLIVFKYIPMWGAQIAFRNYIFTRGFTGSTWVGLQHFKDFFTSIQIGRLLKNTIGISVYSILAGFPLPILLALMLNEVRSIKFKKTVQMVTYAPYFISTVVMVSIILQILDPHNGLINNIITRLGGEPIHFMAETKLFKSIYVWSGVWQMTGYNAIIYIAALAAIDPCLHEAAIVDGASKFQRIVHIDVPGIMPTAVILLILSVGRVMNVGFEKVYLLQNDLNMVRSDVISTYVYRIGLIGSQYSFSTAVGLFNSVVNLILLVSVNAVSRRVSETSLW